jgi:hypothetical protein
VSHTPPGLASSRTLDPLDGGLDHGVDPPGDVMRREPELDVHRRAGMGQVPVAVDQVTGAQLTRDPRRTGGVCLVFTPA